MSSWIRGAALVVAGLITLGCVVNARKKRRQTETTDEPEITLDENLD